MGGIKAAITKPLPGITSKAREERTMICGKPSWKEIQGIFVIRNSYRKSTGIGEFSKNIPYLTTIA
jgi:hypothetical protein